MRDVMRDVGITWKKPGDVARIAMIQNIAMQRETRATRDDTTMTRSATCFTICVIVAERIVKKKLNFDISGLRT